MYTKTSTTQSYFFFLIAPLLLAAHGANALIRLQPPTAVASSSSMVAPLQIRGGALSVDGEGNFYSPRQTPLSRKVESDDAEEKHLKRRRNPSVSPSSSRTADLASRCSVLRGGTKAKNDRIGRLSVDEDGNLYSAQHLVPPPLRFRGGALSVDSEGNLYSPRATATPTLSTKDETPETAPTFIPRRRKSSSSPSSPRTADLASRTVRGSTTAIKNNRFGRLSVDDEGNLYTPPKSQVNARAAALSVRGGGREELREELGITFGCFLFFASLCF